MYALTEEGEVTFANYCRIECIEGISVFCLAVLLPGAIHTVIFAVIGAILIFGKTKKETKYYASVLICLALGSRLFAVILCGT